MANVERVEGSLTDVILDRQQSAVIHSAFVMVMDQMSLSRTMLPSEQRTILRMLEKIGRTHLQAGYSLETEDDADQLASLALVNLGL